MTQTRATARLEGSRRLGCHFVPLAVAFLTICGDPSAVARGGVDLVKPAWALSPVERAKELFREGATKFRAGDFQGALELFEQAYALDPHPVLVYNIARAREGLGEIDRAIEMYERYVALDPHASDRGAVDQRILILKKQLDERAELVRRTLELQAAREREAAAPPPAAAPRASGVSPIPWIAAGVGLVAVGVGSGLVGMASSRHDDAGAEPQAGRARELESSARTLDTAGKVTLGLGAVIVVTGTILGVLDWTSVRSKRQTAAGVAF
jgi:tetratricopeptide (TPR) repeat protein